MSNLHCLLTRFGAEIVCDVVIPTRMDCGPSEEGLKLVPTRFLASKAFHWSLEITLKLQPRLSRLDQFRGRRVNYAGHLRVN